MVGLPNSLSKTSGKLELRIFITWKFFQELSRCTSWRTASKYSWLNGFQKKNKNQGSVSF